MLYVIPHKKKALCWPIPHTKKGFKRNDIVTVVTHGFESLLIRKWHYLIGIRKDDLVGDGLWGFKCSTQAWSLCLSLCLSISVSLSLPLLPDDSDVELTATSQHHVCMCTVILPATMGMD